MKRRDFLKLLGASSIGLLFSKFRAANLFGFKFPAPAKKEIRSYKMYIPVYSDFPAIDSKWIEFELVELVEVQTVK